MLRSRRPRGHEVRVARRSKRRRNTYSVKYSPKCKQEALSKIIRHTGFSNHGIPSIDSEAMNDGHEACHSCANKSTEAKTAIAGPLEGRDD
jgi:hypothetical protein